MIRLIVIRRNFYNGQPQRFDIYFRDDARHDGTDAGRWLCSMKPSERVTNTRVNVRIVFQGESLTVPQWARRIGINENAITWRLRRGWTVEKALTIPLLTQKDRANRELLRSLRS